MKDDVDVKLELPGVVMRQQLGFGDAAGYDRISGECFSLAQGVDTTPLFQGLDDDLCQCPHWGYVVQGALTTTDGAGATETVRAHDLFYWPPGHNVRVDEDAEIVMFSPQREHSHVIDHMIEKVKG
ncbi:MAG TPA: hypothetical protein VMZ66_09475 [Aeromicrobium sp.]|jgi:hypothetical protein|nr:hypothetical protein [Aeromicrobium sp.]